MNTKSLLISNLYFPPQAGGISHFMGSVAASLGPERVCCLTNVTTKVHTKVEHAGVRVYRRPAAFSRSTPVQAVGLGLTLSQIMFLERPKIVQLAMVYEGFIGLWLRRLGLPFVIYAHGNEILDAMESDWPKPLLALRQADCVLANSRFTLDLVQQAGVDSRRTAIVNPGCDVDRFQPRQVEQTFRQRILGPRYNDRVLLTVGLASRKGQDMVIRALPTLLRKVPDVTYVMVGAGPQEYLDELARELRVRDRVIFTGPVSDELLPAIYGLCDLFIMPSRQDLAQHSVEGFGIVFLEANACGKPVIAGRSGGTGDAVVHGVTGFLVDPDDPDDIANAAGNLLTDPTLARRLGEQGRARVLNEFTWGTVGKRIQGILDSVVYR